MSYQNVKLNVVSSAHCAQEQQLAVGIPARACGIVLALVYDMVLHSARGPAVAEGCTFLYSTLLILTSSSITFQRS